MKLEMLLKIKEEVKKQFDAGFLEVAKYPEWVANIVLVPKRNGKVMPFGLKNAGATYQQAMMTLFHDMMHKKVEVYVDDMIVKARKTEDHTTNLERLFKRLREFQLRLNPAKCTFGVTSKKLLDFVINKRGTEVDPDKLLHKHNLGAWNEECQVTFDNVKEYLLSLLVLVPPVAERPLLLYLTVNEGSMGCVLGQHDETEYEACVMGLQAAIERKIRILKVFGDSALVIYQLRGEWETRDSKLIRYPTLAAMFKVGTDVKIQHIMINLRECLAHYSSVEEEVDRKPWYHDIVHYLKFQQYPEQSSKNDKKTIKRLAMNFFLDGDILYRRSRDQVLLRCVDSAEARKIVEEVHEGICGAHASGHMLARQVMRVGYYWLTLETDCTDFA
ncbi:Reverse transcriptase domain - like 10 [Theobroma cacao]|nr:Reverse transcriptase domain - like 10 [Theobroma cacao]